MKLRAPEDVGGVFSHKGRLVEIDADRCVDVSDQEAQALASHGFLPFADDGCVAPPAAMSRQALVARVLDLTRAAVDALSTEELRARLRGLEPQSTPLPDENCGAGVVVDAAAAAVDRMNRVELFAFLRARGTPAPLPIRNEELRARARAALAQATETP
jgi:hypothetical protein